MRRLLKGEARWDFNVWLYHSYTTMQTKEGEEEGGCMPNEHEQSKALQRTMSNVAMPLFKAKAVSQATYFAGSKQQEHFVVGSAQPRKL